MQVITLWMLWQELLAPFVAAFPHPAGRRRFVEWLTGLALNTEEHTVTQSLMALGRPDDWKALETFVEYGEWPHEALTAVLGQLLEEAPGRLWHGYRVWAGDDTKVHRSSKNVWGTCTFHEYSARCPNRAATVRAHNWVVLGALLHNPEQPAWFLPHSASLYFRKAQLPTKGNVGDVPSVFRTKCLLLVGLAHAATQQVPGKHLVVFDGGFALRNVVRSLVLPAPGQTRIDVLTRLRKDARLFALPQPQRGRGRPRRWGRRLAPPAQGGRWPGQWQQAEVFVYGRRRTVRWKEVVCLWGVLGHEVPVKAVAACVQGYTKRFTLVCSAVDLSGVQMVELFCARYRQEDGFRDLKQRLGWEECRAWTRWPILRTTQALLILHSLLRRLQFRLEATYGASWWHHPPWNQRKVRPSVLDLERLLREHREEFRQGLAEYLASAGKSVPEEEENQLC